MDVDKIILGVKKIAPIPHRLEIIKTNNIVIIDDAYNSNPVGSKRALDVLKLMPGKKVVVTPGMIELKDKEYEDKRKKLAQKAINDARDIVNGGVHKERYRIKL